MATATTLQDNASDKVEQHLLQVAGQDSGNAGIPGVVILEQDSPANLDKLYSFYARKFSAAGIRLIRIHLNGILSAPFQVVGPLMEELQQIGGERGPSGELYESIVGEFIHRRRTPEEIDWSSVSHEDYLRFTRVDERLSSDATIGLIYEISEYLLQVCRDRKETIILWIENSDSIDQWSASLIAHLERRLKHIRGSICIVRGLIRRLGNRALKFLKDRIQSYEVLRLSVGQAELQFPGWQEASADEQFVFKYLAMAGCPLLPSELEEVTGRPVESLLESLAEKHLVRPAGTGAGEKDGIVPDSIQAAAVRSELGFAEQRKCHAAIAASLENRVRASASWSWGLRDAINALFLHLLKSGDWKKSFAYQKAYYSSNVNTYLPHVYANLKTLYSANKSAGRSADVARRHLAYQLASDTVRHSAQYQEKLRWCCRYLEIGEDPYCRADVYANLCVLSSNRKTAESYTQAVTFSNAAYLEISKIHDSNTRRHASAIVDNATALLYFRRGRTQEALALQDSALAHLAQASPIRRQILSRNVVLSNKAQLLARLAGDPSAAGSIYSELISQAAAKNDIEGLLTYKAGAGRMFFKARQYERALQYYEECISHAQHFRWLSILMYSRKAAALCCKALGKHEEALQYLSDCLPAAGELAAAAEVAEINRQTGEAHLHLGTPELAIQHYQKAVAIYRQIRAMTPAAQSAGQLAMLLMSAGDQKSAAAYWQQSATLYRLGRKQREALGCVIMALQCCAGNAQPCDPGLLHWAKRMMRMNGRVDEAMRQKFRSSHEAYSTALAAAGAMKSPTIQVKYAKRRRFMSNPFQQLGNTIDKAWSEKGYALEVFPEIATVELAASNILNRVEIADLIHWIITAADEVPQNYREFGNPPVNVYKSPHFFIEVLFWLDSSPSIHQHAFPGAFGVLAGSSVQSEYQFEKQTVISPQMILGNLKFNSSELLKRGDVRQIAPGDSLIHSLFHLERPSLSVVVRTNAHKDLQPQYKYIKPSLAIDPFYKPEPLMTQIRVLDSLKRTDMRLFWQSAQHLIQQENPWLLFTVLSLVYHKYRGTLEWSELLDAARRTHGSLVDDLMPCLEEQDRDLSIVARREQVHEPLYRFLIALLLNVPDKQVLYSLVEKAYPGNDPEKLCLTWIREMAEKRLLGAEFNAVSLHLLESAVHGREFEQAKKELAQHFELAQTDREHQQLLNLWSEIHAFQLFSPLLRKRPGNKTHVIEQKILAETA